MNIPLRQPIEMTIPGTCPADDGASSHLDALGAAMAELSRLSGPAEQAFLGIGSALAEATDIFNRIKSSFATLVERMDGSAAGMNTDQLMAATDRIAKLAGGTHGSIEMLGQLGDMVRRIGARLVAMGKVIGEVDALAINAKIQASIIGEGGNEFTDFTTEIHRLGTMARQTVHQTATRLEKLGKSIDFALTGEQAFEQSATSELDNVQLRLQEGTAILVQHRHASAEAVERIARLTTDTAQRVAACVTELQFNDTACQRVEHVRDALATVMELARSGIEEDLDTLIGAVCRLQALQLSRTAAEYRAHVEIMIANLQGLARDSSGILNDTDAAISSGEGHEENGGRESFIVALERDIALAARLLSVQADERERVKAVLQTVSDGFGETEADLAAIHSIDADMRVMGLNATFKCTRLGSQGRALGIISQELRSCSKRIQEISGQISTILQAAIDMSKNLGTQEGADALLVLDLSGSMTKSLLDLRSLSQELGNASGCLHSDGDQLTGLLDGTASRITIHRQMHESLTHVSDLLNGVADSTGIDNAGISAMGERIRLLLADHYTMQSERLIHQIFADCFDEAQFTTSNDPDTPLSDIDDLLF